jgi:hypothetical protein
VILPIEGVEPVTEPSVNHKFPSDPVVMLHKLEFVT